MTKHQRLQFETLEARQLLASDVGVSLDPLLDLTRPEANIVAEVASIDGSGNNETNLEWGSTDEQLLRLTTVEYADGVSQPAIYDRPSAREVSNVIAAQGESSVNDRYLTDLVWLWGQFIDHDIDLTENAVDEFGNPLEAFPIEVPTGDVYFDPDASGGDTIGFNRSAFDEATGDAVDNPRQQINQITAFLDGSVVYGSDQERADELRTFEGGKLKTSENDLLPFNEAGLPNANPGLPDEALFLAGDVRANENAALTAMQTLWVREHNRIAEEIAQANPDLSDEEIYQQARAKVIAEIQAITYNEFLPALLGPGAISAYEGYDPDVNPGVSNIFSTAAYRFGHSMLSSELLRLNNDGTVIDAGNLSLSDAFFAPGEILANGIDSLLLGAASQQAQEIDNMIVDDVRNFLFGQPGAGGFDLASLNIQRGRDHGLPDYNQARIDLGLDPVESFSDITSDPELAARLEALYTDVNNIDVWVGGLAEDHLPGSSMGELFTRVIVDQFERIRDGDAFWYQNVLSGRELHEVETTTLADVIQRNTNITALQDNVFYDSSVLYFQAPESRHNADISVVINDTTIELVDDRTEQVLESRDRAGVSQVIVVGADGRPTHVSIDVRTQNLSLEGGIVVHGGGGNRDSLQISGMPAGIDYLIDGSTVQVNDLQIRQTGFESLKVSPARGDQVLVLDDGGISIVVEDDRHHHKRHDRDHNRDTRLASDDEERDGPQDRHHGDGPVLDSALLASLSDAAPSRRRR